MSKSNIGIGVLISAITIGTLAVVYMSRSSNSLNSNVVDNNSNIDDEERRSSLFTLRDSDILRDSYSNINKTPEGIWSQMPKPDINIKGGSRRRKKLRRKSRQNKKNRNH